MLRPQAVAPGEESARRAEGSWSRRSPLRRRGASRRPCLPRPSLVSAPIVWSVCTSRRNPTWIRSRRSHRRRSTPISTRTSTRTSRLSRPERPRPQPSPRRRPHRLLRPTVPVTAHVVIDPILEAHFAGLVPVEAPPFQSCRRCRPRRPQCRRLPCQRLLMSRPRMIPPRTSIATPQRRAARVAVDRPTRPICVRRVSRRFIHCSTAAPLARGRCRSRRACSQKRRSLRLPKSRLRRSPSSRAVAVAIPEPPAAPAVAVAVAPAVAPAPAVPGRGPQPRRQRQ